MTTIVNTAGAFTRTTNGSTKAFPKIASKAVLADPQATKSTVTLADQPTHATQSMVLGTGVMTYTGDGVKTTFAIPAGANKKRWRVTGLTVGGTTVPLTGTGGVNFTWAADNSALVFSVPPTNGTAIVITATVTRANVPNPSHGLSGASQ